jgi:hypothetical protein
VDIEFSHNVLAVRSDGLNAEIEFSVCRAHGMRRCMDSTSSCRDIEYPERNTLPLQHAAGEWSV